MSLYFESLKPVQEERTIQKWRNHVAEMRKLLEDKESDCRDIRNASRQIRYETHLEKSWLSYLNDNKLHEHIYDTKDLILLLEELLVQIVKEKKLIEEEKFETEALIQKCDTWIGICLEGLNNLDKKLEEELTRDDDGVKETKQEIKLLEAEKENLRNFCLLAWEESCRLEEAETRLHLNLQFKKEVLAIDIRCQTIEKMDPEVSYKVEPTKGPSKMLTIEEWRKIVQALLDKCEKEIWDSVKLREQMLTARAVFLNKYTIQYEKTNFAMRKRIYEINREKNESQYQILKVSEMYEATRAECTRLEAGLKELKEDLRCTETKCSERFFRASVDATIDPPFTGMNKQVLELRAKVEEMESHLDILRTFCDKLDRDHYKLLLESEAKNRSLQSQVQSLDIRIAGRSDPVRSYAYDPECLLSKMDTQMPPFFTLYSDIY